MTLAEVTWVTAKSQLDSILNGGGKVVIDFTAPSWCQPCIRFAPTFEKAAESLEGITFVAIDVDESPSFVVEYQIQSVPTVKLYEAGSFVRDIKAPQNVIPFIRDIKE